MKQNEYRTITGRRLELDHLSDAERGFLIGVNQKYDKALGWSEFGAWWMTEFKN